MQGTETTKRSKDQKMSTENGYYFGADSGNYGRFAVTMNWTNPPTPGDMADLDQWLTRLTEPESPPERLPMRAVEIDTEHEAWRESVYGSGGALERPDQINIDARHAVIHEASGAKQKYVRCGNCLTRYAITDDPTENHRRAMNHKITCGVRTVDQYSDPQHAQLTEEFSQQPMQVLFRERAQQAIEAGADPGQLKITGVPLWGPRPAPERPQLLGPLADDSSRIAASLEAPWTPRRWWQFWRWFE
jgi:hypothetical protein